MLSGQLAFHEHVSLMPRFHSYSLFKLDVVGTSNHAFITGARANIPDPPVHAASQRLRWLITKMLIHLAHPYMPLCSNSTRRLITERQLIRTVDETLFDEPIAIA